MAAAYASVRIPVLCHSPHLTPSRLLPAQRNARTSERVPRGARRGRPRDTLTRPSALKASCGARVGRRTRSFPHWGGAALRWGVQESLPVPAAPHRILACLSCRYEPIPRAAEFPPGVESVRSPRPARSRCRCGRSEPSPGADVPGVRPVECPRVPSNVLRDPAVLPSLRSCPGRPHRSRALRHVSRPSNAVAGVHGHSASVARRVAKRCRVRATKHRNRLVLVGSLAANAKPPRCVATCRTGAGRASGDDGEDALPRWPARRVGRAPG